MADTPQMPELPPPDTHCYDEDTGKDVWSHSADQMRAYAQAYAAQQVREALERAAQACLGEAVEVVNKSDVAYNHATDHCAEAIRAMAAEIQPPQKAGTD